MPEYWYQLQDGEILNVGYTYREVNTRWVVSFYLTQKLIIHKSNIRFWEWYPVLRVQILKIATKNIWMNIMRLYKIYFNRYCNEGGSNRYTQHIMRAGNPPILTNVFRLPLSAEMCPTARISPRAQPVARWLGGCPLQTINFQKACKKIVKGWLWSLFSRNPRHIEPMR